MIRIDDGGQSTRAGNDGQERVWLAE